MKLFTKKSVALGDGEVIAYTIIEIKQLFSIILYNWKTTSQDRFHSHAFPAVAFTLSGSYNEEYLTKYGVQQRTVKQWLLPRYIPRNFVHRIMKALPNTWTIIFAGPWQKTWYEYFDDTETSVKYTWGRKILEKKEMSMKMFLLKQRKKLSNEG